MKVKCKCGAIYELAAKFAGKSLKCKTCGAGFRIPDSNQTNHSTGTAPANTGTPVKRIRPRKTPAQIKREKEDALLAKYDKSAKSKGVSTEDFIADNFRDSFESKRHDNAVYSIAYGVACLVLAFVLFIILDMLEKGGGVAPKIIAALAMVRGKYWAPPIVFLFGVWKLVSGISELKQLHSNKKDRSKTK